MNTREKIEFARNTIKPRQELMFHEIIDIVNHCEQINTKKGDDPKEAWFWAIGACCRAKKDSIRQKHSYL